MKRQFNYAFVILSFISSASAWSACLNSGVQIQILGSGGPADSGGRASASYIIWINGVSRIMLDTGSGTKDQFYRSGANLDDIELVALSHLHPDHSVELPGILWPAGGRFDIAGPSGANVFPSIGEFLERLFGPRGAYHVLDERIELTPITVDVTSPDPVEVWRAADIVIQGRGVPHGDVPTIGYRLNIGGSSIAFASDQTGSDPTFTDFIRGVDVLVIHMSSTEDATGLISELHAKPSVWGQMAADADAGHLVVSHIASSSVANAPFSPQVLNQSLAFLTKNYSGPITVGEDLLCIEVN
ncbi:MAG: MBL fold metallo-hydrolase [Arenicellaceae bacterium]|nr:MBL fold metallo-hydrolase [Arenicellaceae bacterium]